MNSLSSLMEEVQVESNLRNKEIINYVISNFNNDNFKIIIDPETFCPVIKEETKIFKNLLDDYIEVLDREIYLGRCTKLGAALRLSKQFDLPIEKCEMFWDPTTE